MWGVTLCVRGCDILAVHLYLHVPFCARRCSYCDFAIAVRRATPDRAFADAITAEWQARGHHPSVAEAREIATIYFGGGTPSRLAADTIAELLDRLTRDRPLAPDAEVTLEANPDDVTTASARGWFRAGVTRISLGVQSHDPAALAWMHRTHVAEQVAPAMATLRAAGLTNISLDLIFALPAELARDWRRDLELTLALEPEHLSLYGLTIEPHTPLARWTDRGTVRPTTDDRYERDYLEAHRQITAAGFEHYEVSNAARPGRRARHNAAYWGGAEYLGLGPSAHSFLGGVRSWNEREWVAYAKRVAEEGGEVTAGEERLDAEQLALEGRYLGLRTDGGLPLSELPDGLANRWVAEGWAAIAGARIRLTPMGWLRLDALVTRLAVS